MKPSQRISEIQKSIIVDVNDATEAHLLALEYYLDEEWEKEKERQRREANYDANVLGRAGY